MTQRTVKCAKFNEELPALAAPPFGGDLGQQIYQRVSSKAWTEWQDDMMIKVINEYRLNMADPEHYEVLLKQMRSFLNLDGESGSTLEVGNSDRGRS